MRTRAYCCVPSDCCTDFSPLCPPAPPSARTRQVPDAIATSSTTTSRSFAAAQTWWETVPVLEGWLEHRLVTESDAELNEHARVHLDYLRSEEFKEHMIGVLAYL